MLMGKKQEELISVRINEFIDFIEKSEKEYRERLDDVDKREKANLDFLHQLEFSTDKLERNRIATKIHNNQVQRRKSKDRLLELEEIYKFSKSPSNKNVIKTLKQLIDRQIKTEEYVHGERHYNEKGGDVSNANNNN